MELQAWSQADVAVCGLFPTMYVDCLLNYGVLAAMALEHVRVTDVITIKALAAVIIIVKQFLQHLDVSTQYVQLEYSHAAVKSVQHVPGVLAMLMVLV
jgi:hypothetical protein